MLVAPSRVRILLALLIVCPALTLSAQTARVIPGNDFFAYANDAWLQATVIPQGKEHWGAREEISALARKQVARLLDDARTAPAGSTARKVADYRAAWRNEAAIEARGRTPIQSQIDAIDSVTDKAGLTRLLAHRMRADVDPLNWGVYESSSLLGLSVEPSIHGEKTYVAFVLQGGLGLPERELYLSDKPDAQAARTKYREYIGTLLSFAGVDHADHRAKAVLALETAIARTHATHEQSANDHNADTVWTHDDFNRRAPGMDWHAFFAAAGLGKQHSLVAWQPAAITGVAALIASQPLDVWKDYFRVHAVAEYADVLPLRAAMPGQPRPGSRDERALAATQAAMSDAIGHMYAERYFPAEHKARVQRIAGNVVAAFIKRVEAATWMEPATHAIALGKLKKLYIGIGYPEQWEDYSALVVDPDDPAGNLQRIADRRYHRALARLGRPVDMKEWWLAPQAANALLVFQQNMYAFSAALLQPPKFDAAASDAESYGAIGAIIGHDVTHYVDVLGAEYLPDGAMRHWWTTEDSSHYAALSEPLVRQFSGYRPFPDAAVDGRLTLRENIADLAGLAAAFDAYRLTLGKRVTDSAYVRQQDRAFFIAFAQAWRTKLSDAGMRAQLSNDHAPEMYRYSTVRNLDAWYDAFDVVPGQRLFLEPAARVRIW